MPIDRPYPLFRVPSTDQPDDPNDDFGPSRVVARLTAEGVVEYRPNDLVVDLSELGLADDAGAEEVKTVVARNVGDGGLDFSVDEVQGGFARLTIRGVDPLDFVNRSGVSDAFSINAVFRTSALTADPIKFAGSLTADPIKFASALGIDPIKFANASTARPVGEPTNLLEPQAFACSREPTHTTVAIVDTGKPAIDADGNVNAAIEEKPDANGDHFLDIAAGHALFIHHIVERAEPSVSFWFEGVMGNDGDGDDFELGAALDRIRTSNENHEHLIVNLSLSGYYPGDICPPVICKAIEKLQAVGALVVAAAGNDGACRKKFPAAMDGVVSVGAFGPCGPTDFSNHGHWVDASAPGEDIVSCFFDGFDGAFNPPLGSQVPDIDDFHGWAMWSGTSFSTPAVVGAIAQAMRIYECTALQAKEIVLGRRGLFRVPDYGVVVNRVF